MGPTVFSRFTGILCFGGMLCTISAACFARAELVAVRYPQGTTRGFVVLRDAQGDLLAVGDVLQTVRGDRVTSRLTFHFKDGSIDDETTVFSQKNVFRLIRDHRIQRGPSYPTPMDTSVDAATGIVTSRTKDKNGEEKVTTVRMKVPPDLSNGLALEILTNLKTPSTKLRVSYLLGGEKPRIVHLSISPNGESRFLVAGAPHKAMDYLIQVDLGGVAGVIAPVLGKEPKDIHVWVLEGEVPSFVRAQAQFYVGGPVWGVELVSPDYASLH